MEFITPNISSCRAIKWLSNFIDQLLNYLSKTEMRIMREKKFLLWFLFFQFVFSYLIIPITMT